MKTNIPIKTTYATLSILLFGILLSIQLGYSAFYGILLGIFAAYRVGFSHGYTHKELFSMLMKGLKSAWVVLLMMGLIGIIIGVWMISGTIPTMIYMGFEYLSHLNFVLAAFFISSIISMILGTSLGTVSTVGMALIGVGKGLGIPLPLLTGAIVSGSYIGDRSSPMSSSANLTAAITQTKLIDNLKHMLSTLIPMYIGCTIFYYFMGKDYVYAGKLSPEVMKLQNILFSNFKISIISLVPPFLIMCMAILGFSMLKSLSVGLFSSFLFILFYNPLPLSQVAYAAFMGFHPKNIEISSMLSGGGLFSMKNVILIIGASTAFNGILDGTGMIQPLIKKFISHVKNVGDLILRTSFLSLLIDLITCNQTLSIIIPGKFLSLEFEKMHISKNTLARTISDMGIVIVPLIPWNANAIIISTIFGVPVLNFAPYAIFCYLIPILTIIYGYMGWVKKVSNRTNL